MEDRISPLQEYTFWWINSGVFHLCLLETEPIHKLAQLIIQVSLFLETMKPLMDIFSEVYLSVYVQHRLFLHALPIPAPYSKFLTVYYLNYM